ncbi:hypothetical protein SVIO_033680 [Streptomyces violaceusniger]|uniref:Uncharacterized protein n=1 Tax=Streptomyces violaceusniger TaxID=68280 RepID=A0A4D4KUX8_STRVO|nr:hypothetical protein SVIO_033680 [Streptomyces violaceusniger]
MVEAAGLVEPGGGAVDGDLAAQLLADVQQQLTHPAGQVLDGLTGRLDPHRRREEEVEGHPDTGPDQGLQHPVPGVGGHLRHAEDQHGADRHLLDPVAHACEIAGGLGGEDDQAQTPPGQPYQHAEGDGDQDAHDHGLDPAQASGEGRVQGDLDDEEGGERGGERGGFLAQLEGDDVRDGRRRRGAHSLDDDRVMASFDELRQWVENIGHVQAPSTPRGPPCHRVSRTG